MVFGTSYIIELKTSYHVLTTTKTECPKKIYTHYNMEY